MKALIESARVEAFRIPTADEVESDGTLEWSSTTLVTLSVRAGGVTGFGYGYADASTALLLKSTLIPFLEGHDALDTAKAWKMLQAEIRNLGQSGIGAMAISIADIALWDTKAKLLDLPLFRLLGACRYAIPVYGSGGLTSYSHAETEAQFRGWRDQGVDRFKMKIGRDPKSDIERVRRVRQFLDHGFEIFVDANGAHTPSVALAQAEALAPLGVTWFEEPVPSDDLEGLAYLRSRMPAGMQVAAGEYGYSVPYFARMIPSVDVLQADATRCLGVTGFMAANALCEAHARPLSSHCAPTLHAHLDCAAHRAIHLEYFVDHARIENLLFDGAPQIENGTLSPDPLRPGLGVEFKRKDAERYAL